MNNLAQAYDECRRIARREAKNFYYAFRVLPREKRNGICAVYAFMRRADDIADDETQSIEQRRETMAAWLVSWRQSRSSRENKNAVFYALADTQERFGIPDTLLEELVCGTTMDLEPAGSGPAHPVDLGDGLQGYRDYDSLYRYCYLVASVVGLVCIRIFGYSDLRAEFFAEQLGVAFQLTNILRDIREDAQRGRVYLPQDLLTEYHVSNADILSLACGAVLLPHQRAMINALAVQASHLYGAGWQLIPLVDRDSRAALWVLVKIYSDLLLRIERRDSDVFSSRVRVPTPAKLGIFAQGVLRAVTGR